MSGGNTELRWIAAWPGAAIIASANGALREAIYAQSLGQKQANRLSGVTLVTALAIYFWKLNRRWPMPSNRAAASIGAAWVGLTVVFEFGLGRGVEKKSWGEMLDAYNLAEGETWPLVLAWIGIGPSLVGRAQHRWNHRGSSAAGSGPRRGKVAP